MNRYIARLRAAPALALALVLLAGCESAEPLGPISKIPIELTRVSSAEASCQGTWCGYRLTIGTTNPETGAKVSARLRISGDGRYPRTMDSTLPDGTATIFWEFLSAPGEYRLFVCPDADSGADGDCLTYVATRLPPS